jgi:hypothetical protein
MRPLGGEQYRLEIGFGGGALEDQSSASNFA